MKRRKVLKVAKKKKRSEEETSDQEDGQTPEAVNSDVCGSMMDYSTHSSSGDVLNTPFYQQFNPNGYKDSQEAARDLLRMLVYPLTLEKFHR